MECLSLDVGEYFEGGCSFSLSKTRLRNLRVICIFLWIILAFLHSLSLETQGSSGKYSCVEREGGGKDVCLYFNLVVLRI